MKKIVNLFIAGISAILPLSLTIYLLYWVFMLVDSISAAFVSRLLGREIIGLGFIVTILLILLIGYVTKNYFGKKIFGFVDKIVTKLPIAKTIYGTIKEVSNSIFSEDKKSFQQPVLIDYPYKGVKSIAFLTNHDSSFLGKDGKEVVAVFMPTTPNPTNGFLFYVKKSEIEILDISVDEALRLIISMGVIGPSKDIKNENPNE